MSSRDAPLSELLDAVEKGENVQITRRGRLIADLVPKFKAQGRIDLVWLESATVKMTPTEDSADLIRALRDDARF